ncbi:hypothetical protein MNBD_GAMMA24-1078 [hydrothermal vent metagenome]|uniref:HD/PDEase domain-containing protein n=1 Tax=hydrothermal vent metagenome TaxID=652676 RepID=A0A3B1BPI3_9ZZZZ
MEEPENNSADQTSKEEMDQWIKEHEDSLDYPDVPVDRGYRIDDSELSPETRKAMAERDAQLTKESGISDSALILKATQFAAIKHRDQRRKDSAASPYIIHPVTVANNLTQAGITDPEVIAAALLHDTLEDTQTTPAELVEMFGERVASMVQELTDDKDLPKQERKRLQVEHAPHLSPGAALVKICDKIANVTDVTHSPPPDWSNERRMAYLDWAASVVAGCKVDNDRLVQQFADVLEAGREAIL